MSDLGGGTFWSALIGSNAVTGALAYLLPAFVTRKKDVGDQAMGLIIELRSELNEVKAEQARCHRETTELRQISVRNDLVIRLVVPELQRVSPYSTALAQARGVLGAAFPIDLNTPPDMTETLQGMDQP